MLQKQINSPTGNQNIATVAVFPLFALIAKHGEWACNICGAAQLKPKTPEEVTVRQQREAREELSSALTGWGRANNCNWNPAELRGVTEAL